MFPVSDAFVLMKNCDPNINVMQYVVELFHLQLFEKEMMNGHVIKDYEGKKQTIVEIFKKQLD